MSFWLALFVIALLVVTGLFGWRMMKRANVEKAAVLSSLVGEAVTLKMSSMRMILPTLCVVVRVDGDQVVVRDRDNPERIYPLAAIVDVDHDGCQLGRW